MHRTLLALVVTTLLITDPFSTSALARAIPEWPYEKLVAAADIVAVLEPLANQRAKDSFPESSYGHPEDFDATNTRFRVQATLKPPGDAPKELTVLHFSYSKSKRATVIVNGANFVRFLIGPLQYEKRDLKNEKIVGGMAMFQEEPVWLAFLKRRSDGRFEPVTGQCDSAFSFRELHHASFFAQP